MLSPFDDYPIHQTPLPLAHAGDGHPDHYDRYWFNGYNESTYFGIALGTYPNRGVIDAGIGVVHEGVQRSVYASGLLPLDRTHTTIGPISVEVIEPMRSSRITIAENDYGISGELTFTARTAAIEEPRQIKYLGERLQMDVTRATQLGSWSGYLLVDGTRIDLDDDFLGTKDRSWGIRPVGDPAPAAPPPQLVKDPDPKAVLPQIFFLWAPLNFDDTCVHYMVFEDRHGTPWSKTVAELPVLELGDDVVGPGAKVIELDGATHELDLEPGFRRSLGARIAFGDSSTIELEPLFTFRMRGAGYHHPIYPHGRWHGGEVVGGEVHRVEELDNLEFHNIHVQQVVRATWGDRTGIGVLEQLIIGPHEPTGLQDLLDGAPS